MQGPGPHMMYAIGSGLVLTTLTNGRFSPHHTLIYTVNSFFGPDIGSFTEWLASVVGGFDFGSELADAIHHPFYYVIILGLPLCVSYSELSRILPLNKVLDSFPPENGNSSMYPWILSTGWWEGRAPINPDAVIVVGALCIALIGGFIYINRESLRGFEEVMWQRMREKYDKLNQSICHQSREKIMEYIWKGV